MKTQYKGIDYGRGQTNVDADTGVRYGIIPLSALHECAIDDFEPQYSASCPECGAEVDDPDDLYNTDADGFICAECGHVASDSSVYWHDEPDCWTYDADGIQAHLDSYNDVWVTKSQHYTKAQFCSPCAPGACYLTNPCETGEKAYCLPADWFDNDTAPYTLHAV